VERLGLRHVVITSPNRDDLPDGGSGEFAATIRHIRSQTPNCRIEVLIPDFKGETNALDVTLSAHPDIVNHNIETVPRLFQSIRPQGSYQRSLDVLAHTAQSNITTKSGMIVGMGESMAEIKAVMQDLRLVNCTILTIGQYLQPTTDHRPVSRFYHPEAFEELRNTGINMGFTHVEAGPLVRSSYHAEQQGWEVHH
tara:strand:+ start:3119 stop:3706 length:588 start_codon:yes stop_codon:yes gene_type:complete